MITSRKIGTSRGFSLVELLVVMVIMGLVITSVYSLFLNTKRTSSTSEDVVDVQQNLRVAMETMVSDIRMAGFLIPNDESAIVNAPIVFGKDENRDNDCDDAGDSGDDFVFSTSSSWNTYARILRVDAAGLVVEADKAGLFRDAQYVRIIRPSTNVDISTTERIIGTIGTVVDVPVVTPPNILIPIDGILAAFTAGDIIIRKYSGEDSPVFIQYMLRPTLSAGTNNYELMRYVRNKDDSIIDSSVIARNISALSLTYLLADGTPTTDPDQIRAIRINMTSQTDENRTQKNSNIKTRSLQTVVKIQNAFGG